MSNKQIFITLLIPCFAISCATGPGEKEKINIEGKWEFEGLEQLEINNINEETSPMLFSTSNGIYSKNENGFIEFGLQDKEVVTGVVQLSGQEYIAALHTLYLDRGDTTLFKTTNGGKDWAPFMSNFGGNENKYTRITCITNDPDHRAVIYTCGGGNIARSVDGGAIWDSVYLRWDALGAANFVKTDPAINDIVWAGGSNAIFEPRLVHSDDGGDTWTNLSKNLQIIENTTYETNSYDIIVRTEKSSHLLLGLGNGILKSISNGETWSKSFKEAGITTFTHSTLNPEIIYASGRNTTGTLFFLGSDDFGDTWQTITFEDSPGNIHVNDMVSVLEYEAEVIYLGTNKGLYSFTVD